MIRELLRKGADAALDRVRELVEHMQGWRAFEADEDPERVEAVYQRRTRRGGIVQVTWHDGNTEKWQWFYTPRGADLPEAFSQDTFATPHEARAAADRWVEREDR